MNFKKPITNAGALLNSDRTHRYSLWRIWNEELPRVLFIGLNPSRADESYNDPTITRCINFAQRWQTEPVTFEEYMTRGDDYKRYGGMYFLNLFSFRTPYPEELQKAYLQGDAYHDKTEEALHDAIENSKTVVCCWGSWKFIESQAEHVLGMIKEPMCFGVNKDGNPKHPLYLKATTELVPYVK